MEPGPELDKRVCEAVGIAPIEGWWESTAHGVTHSDPCRRVLEGKLRGTPWEGGELSECFRYPPVSTDIGAAWQVVEALVNRRIYPTILPGVSRTGGNGWFVNTEEPAPLGSMPGKAFRQNFADTMPFAVCIATLRVLENA